MKNNSPNSILNASIEQLEIKRAQELILLKAEVTEIRERLKTSNLIKNTIKTVTSSNDIKTGIGKTIIGLASGFLIKKVLFRKVQNPIIIAAGYLLQTSAIVFVANNADKINATGKSLLKTIISKFKRKDS